LLKPTTAPLSPLMTVVGTRHDGAMAKRRFGEFSPRTRKLIMAAGVGQAALLLAAQIDITRRPAEQVRGPKLGWRLVSLLNFVGPLAYFRWGRLAGRAGR
jgi:hypothetical protein